MSVAIAKGIFKDRLPNIVLDQIFFDQSPDYQGGATHVSLEFIHQIPAEWSTVNPYGVMLILCNHPSVIQGFRNYPATAKQAILDADILYPSTYVKFYLPGDLSGEVSQFPEIMNLGGPTPGALLQKRTTITLPPIPSGHWPNMYLYAITYQVDPQAVCPSGLTNTSLSTIRVGSPLSETIYLNHSPSTLGVVYTLATSVSGYGNKGEAWYGPVHRTGEGGNILMAGELHGDHVHPNLAITTVSNQKTIDGRVLRQQEIEFQNINSAASGLNQSIMLDIETAQNITGPPGNGITDLQFSRTTSGILKTVFSINYAQLVKANTRMSFLFRNHQSLNGCFEVENMRLFRTRVKSAVASNKLTPGKINICGAGEQGTPKLVATLTDSSINAITYGFQSPGVTTYVGNDVAMAGLDGGVYEYTLYVDGVDNSLAAVNHVLELLKTALTAYDGWISTNFYGTTGAEGSSISQRIRAQSMLLQQDSSRAHLIDTYLSALLFIFGLEPFQLLSFTDWRKNLLAMSNPNNGSLANMEAVATLVRNFYSLLSHSADPPTVGANSNTFSVHSQIAASTPISRRLVLKNVFPSTYHQRFAPTTGFDFLDDRLTSPSVALSGLSYGNFGSRMAGEIQKYETNTNVANVTGFLTPARIRTPTNIINTSNLSVGLLNTVDLFAAKRRAGAPVLSFHASTPATGSAMPSQVQELLAMGALTARPLILDIQTIKNLSTPTAAQAAELNLVASSDFLGSGSMFNTDDGSQLAATSGSTEQNILYSNPNSNDPTISIMGSGLVMTLINSQLENFSQATVVTPNGIAGSLAFQKISQLPLLIEQSNAATVAINFNSIKRVEYFQGYASAAGGDLIAQPIWSILTQDMYNLAQAQSAPLLCRTQDTPDVTSGGNSLELPGYDNLFILGNATTTITSRSYTPYITYYGMVMDYLQSSATQTATNVSTAFSNVKPFLIRVPLMSADPNPPEVGEHNSAEGVFSGEEFDH